jgi:AcrR family transcriptional regulator
VPRDRGCRRAAAAALAIADAEGFDAVSMRRVATELGAGTMTLYHYVRTKDDLVALCLALTALLRLGGSDRRTLVAGHWSPDTGRRAVVAGH